LKLVALWSKAVHEKVVVHRAGKSVTKCTSIFGTHSTVDVFGGK